MMYGKSLRFGFVFTALFLLVMPAVSSGQTLREILKWDGIDFKITQQADLDKKLTSGDSLDSNEARIITTYVDEGGHLSETLYVFRFDKSGGRWSAAELKPHCGGAITGINCSKNFIYLKGHINPSACCTIVLTEELEFHDEVHGWVEGLFDDESVVYYRNQIHFAPAHCVELSIYSPQTRTHRQIYPMKPYQEIRSQYLAKVRAAYEKCCVETPPADCGRDFYNHPCDAERFNSHLGSPVAINDATNALAFVAVFADSVMEQGKIVSEHIEVVYIYRNVTNGRKMEYREFLLYDLRKKYGDLALSRYLEPMMLQKLFSQQ